MSETTKPVSSRREFLQNTGRITAATTLAGLTVPRVHAAEDNTIRVALIGCGGRGTGAAADAMSVKQGPVKLVAMADVFENRLRSSLNNLKRQSMPTRSTYPRSASSSVSTAYQKGDGLPEAGRRCHLSRRHWRSAGYISPMPFEKGLNVFMEKPLTADGPTSKRMLELAEESVAKNLKVGVGLMSRHSRALQELHQRIQDGAIGDIVTMRGYRMTGRWDRPSRRNGPASSSSELLWQIKRFHSFIWASGGCFNDFYIHVVDHCCWMKNAWPVKAQARWAAAIIARTPSIRTSIVFGGIHL